MRFIFLLLIPFALFAQEAFTGKVLRNKVRLRLQPNLEGKILRELNQGDLILVTGESGEFYTVKAPEDVKGFVFRTYILDNVVEGNRVNIRLEPDLEGAVIGQLNKGEQVNGTISSLNHKWLEVTLPEAVHFYVSKEYVEKVGDATMISRLQKRQEEVNTLLVESQKIVQEELSKPFEQIQLDSVYIRLNKITQFSDFQEHVAKAKELLKHAQETFLQKKIQYLEDRAKGVLPNISPKMAAWVPVEAQIYEFWAKDHGQASINDFYTQQSQEATILVGTVEPYNRAVHNKPGDYMLISKTTRLPSAYLYSTQVDLQSKIGQEVTLIAAPRPNFEYAFPAYFVLGIKYTETK